MKRKTRIVLALVVFVAFAAWGWGKFQRQGSLPWKGQTFTVDGKVYEFTADATQIDDWWMVQFKPR